MLCHPATNEQAESFVKMWKRALRKGEFASAQAVIDVFLLPYGNTIHPATDDVSAIRLYGRALRPERSVAGAVSRPTLVRDFDVGQRVMGPANCLVQIDVGEVWKRHVEQRHVAVQRHPPPCRTTWSPHL